MKTKLEYEFNLPEDSHEFEVITRSSDIVCALENIKSSVRAIWKYDNLGEDEQKIVDKIYDIICEEVSSLGLDI